MALRAVGATLVLLLGLLPPSALADPRDDLVAARKALDSESTTDRVGACRRLGELGLREGIPALIGSLRDKNASVREAAIDALAAIGDEVAVPHVARMLEDRSPTVRGRAAIALGNMAGRYAARRVSALLADPDPGVRICAVKALGELGDPLTGVAIRRLLDRTEEDPDHVLLSTAIVALTRLEGRKALEDLFERVGAAEAFESWLVHSTLVWAVGETGDRERLPFLRRAHASDDARVSGAAASALVRVGEAGPVLAALQSEDPIRRRAAVAALVEAGGLKYKDRILEMTKDADARVWLEAVIGLSRIGAREAFPDLLKGLSSSSALIWGGCANELKRAYGRDLGRNPGAWADWYRANRERLTWDAKARVWR